MAAEIKVYSTDTCPWCVKVKEFLTENGIEFTPVNISKDRRAAMELVKMTKQMAVPVTQIGEKFIIGYDPDAIMEAIKTAENE